MSDNRDDSSSTSEELFQQQPRNPATQAWQTQQPQASPMGARPQQPQPPVGTRPQQQVPPMGARPQQQVQPIGTRPQQQVPPIGTRPQQPQPTAATQQMQRSAFDQRSSQLRYNYPQAPSYPPIPQQRRRRGSTALMVVLCLFLAIGSGFAGGFIANYMRQNDYASDASSGYQPVDTPQANDASQYSADPSVSPLPEAVVPSILTNTTAKTLLTVPEVASAVRDSVVEIKTETVTNGGWLGNYVAEGAGSGVIISPDGYIVTNNHVISGAESITVRLSDGREFSASLIGTDSKTDIAVIKISVTGLSPAVFGDSAKLVVGESAIAVGNPLGELGGTVTCGIISALDRDIVIDGETMSLLQTDAAVNPGNSGGGLFNLYGELIGVVNAKSGGLNVEGLGFAVPVNTAMAVIKDLTAYGYVRGRIDDGLELVDIQTTQAARLYRVSQAGLYIYTSKDDRLLSGDRITSVNGVLITKRSDYDEALKDRAVGDDISITVARGTQTLTFEITLFEWRP